MKRLTDINGARRYIVAFETAELQLFAQIEHEIAVEAHKRRGYQC